MVKYFFRLDDIAPNMNWDNFNLAVEVFKNNDIKPLVAVIPDVKDPKLLSYPFNPYFWQFMTELINSGWIIAQHGYQHLSYGGGGVLKIHKSGEFAGFSFEDQKTMINAGYKIMESKNITPDVFVAPRHSFDKNTLGALKQNNFHFISDGIALWPFKKWGLVWLPQILWRPRIGMIGLVTVALHTNTMSVNDIKNLEKFVEKNRKNIGDFRELMEWHDRQNVASKFITFLINQPFKIFWRIVFKIKFLSK
ncbi:MAG: DUF2334 domain-containing protein [bacterium]|nr:DUF2334 domain-containing protein [bacterium]